MVDFEALRIESIRLSKLLDELFLQLQIEKLESTCKELEKTQQSENFWDDMEKATEVNRQLVHIQNKVNRFYKLKERLEDTQVLIELIMEDGDESEGENIGAELKSVENLLEELKLETLLTGKYDANNAILTLHAGAGGTEAQDWASMLYRMYSRFVERKGYKATVLDLLDGEEAGIKSVTMLVEGINAYGYLKAEKGVHRLVRISPFDSSARRHTSFALLEVMPEIEHAKDVTINPEELRIDTYRSSGAGGQHVNKTESAVRITHIPSGIVVQCQNERSQIQNREQAMKLLVSKLIEKQEREQLEQAQSLKGDFKKIEWGSQIRSYVFCPYTMVKDHRTNYENTNVDAVMDGDIDGFIIEYLKKA